MRSSYMTALLRHSFLSASGSRGQFAIQSGTMFAQNLLFFALWIIFFRVVPSVGGWTLADIGAFHGVLNAGIGLAFFFADGARRLGTKVLTGDLDIFLARPRHPLPQLLTVQANASSLGDIAFGLFLIAAFAHLDATGLVMAAWVTVTIAGLFVAVAIFFQSLAFFTAAGPALAEELFNMILCLGTVPQNLQGMVGKFILFTILPAGFMTIVPVEILRHHSPLLLLGLTTAVTAYLVIAVAMFHAGLRRYTSATGWSA